LLLVAGCDGARVLSRYQTQLAVVSNQETGAYAKVFAQRIDEEIALIEADIASSANNSVSMYQQLTDKRNQLAEYENTARVLRAEIAQLEALVSERDATRSIEVMKAIENTSFNQAGLHRLAYLYEVKNWAARSEDDVIHQTVKTWLSDQIKSLIESNQTISVESFYTEASKGVTSKTPSTIPFPPIGPDQIK
jgi:hypothetical protein